MVRKDWLKEEISRQTKLDFVHFFPLNGNLALSDDHFEGIPEEVSSSSHVMFAVQRFFGS